MINWFIAGHEIADDHWYFDEAEGGRVLGNLCHWTDLTLHLVGFERAFPCEVSAITPPDARSDFIVSVIFADNSCACITFSAKGHTFEGVREVLNVHRGNLLGSLIDFKSLSVDVVERRHKTSLLYRNHGHQENIVNSLAVVKANDSGESKKYINRTANFFLSIKEAIETGDKVIVSG
jgi:hypothetical protein